MKRLIATGFTALLLSTCIPNFLSASWNTRRFDDLNPVVELSGDIAYREVNGNPVFNRLGTVTVRVIIYNNGNHSFKDLPVTASLVWDSNTTCNRMSDGKLVDFIALEELPGNSVSGPHLLTIRKGSYSFMQFSYVIPDTVCPNAVRVKLDAGRRDLRRYDSLLTGYSFVIR